MSDRSTTPRPRVILGATCFADAEAALPLSVQLAKELGAGLHGLLVSDESILAAVNRAEARVVSFSGGTVTHVTVEAMRSAFRADARLFERSLIRAAHDAVSDTAFSAVSGRLMPALAQIAGVGDLIVVGFRRPIRDGDSLVLVLGNHGADEVALKMAQRLARTFAKRLVIFATIGTHAAIANWFGRQPPPGVELRRYVDTGTLLAELERMSPAGLIIATDQPSFPPLSRLLDAARCPIVLSVPPASA